MDTENLRCSAVFAETRQKVVRVLIAASPQLSGAVMLVDHSVGKQALCRRSQKLPGELFHVGQQGGSSVSIPRSWRLLPPHAVRPHVGGLVPVSVRCVFDLFCVCYRCFWTC